MSLCYTDGSSMGSTCTSYCFSVPVAYCSQYDAYTYYIPSDVLNITSSLNFCYGNNITQYILNYVNQLTSSTGNENVMFKI